MFGSYFTTGYTSNNTTTNNKSSTSFSNGDHKNINSSSNLTSSFLVQQQSSQQYQHKVVNSLFASSRFSDKKESNDGYRFTESSKQTEVKQPSNDSLPRSNLSRQGSYELRQSINFIAPHSDEKMRNSFLSQKNSCSAKHLTCHSPTSTAMFFPKSELIPKTFQKKIHEGNIWLGPKNISISNTNSSNSKTGNGYVSPTSRNSNIGLLGSNKFRSKNDQNSTLRASLPSQQYISITQEYEHEKDKQSQIFNESELGEKMSQEKENDQYYFSQMGKKPPSTYDESNFLKQACSNSNSDINRNTLRISSEKKNNTIQHFEQKVEGNAIKMSESYKQTNQISSMKITQEESNLSDVPQSLENNTKNNKSSKIQQQFSQSKSKNLQQLLKTTDQQYQSSKMTYGCYLKSEMPSLPYSSTADTTTKKQTQSQQQVNSSSSPSEHINDILVSAETSSSKSSDPLLLHHMIAKRFTTEQAPTTKRQPPSQGSSNSHNVYSLQDSFFSPQNQNSERDENHYFSKEVTNVDSRGSFQKQQTQNNQPLAGSIVNVKKTKKKQEDIQSQLKSSQQDLNVQLRSSINQGQSNSSHPVAESKHIEVDGDLLIEIQNLRRINSVLTLKTESLQKEKKHFRDLASRKTEECENLNEQLNQLKIQFESLKASRINNYCSQEGTSTNSKLLHQHHALLISANNVSSTQLDTPRQIAGSQALSNNFLFPSSSNNLAVVRNSLNLPQVTIQDYQDNSKITLVSQDNKPQLVQQTQENNNQQEKSQPNNNNYQQQSSQTSLPYHQNYHSPCLPLGIQMDCQFSPQNRAYSGTSTKHNDGQHHSKHQGLSPIVNSQERSDFISNSILDDIPSVYSQQMNSSLVIQTSSSSQNFNQFQQHPFLIQNSQQINLFREQ